MLAATFQPTEDGLMLFHLTVDDGPGRVRYVDVDQFKHQDGQVASYYSESGFGSIRGGVWVEAAGGDVVWAASGVRLKDLSLTRLDDWPAFDLSEMCEGRTYYCDACGVRVPQDVGCLHLCDECGGLPGGDTFECDCGQGDD